MPERKSVITVDASAVQGDGAWVKVHRISYGQQQTVQMLVADLNNGKLPKDMSTVEVTSQFLVENDRYTRALLAECVVAWNWVDDAGAPLPLPRDGGIDGLLQAETAFLIKAIQGQAIDAKN